MPVRSNDFSRIEPVVVPRVKLATDFVMDVTDGLLVGAIAESYAPLSGSKTPLNLT